MIIEIMKIAIMCEINKQPTIKPKESVQLKAYYGVENFRENQNDII